VSGSITIGRRSFVVSTESAHDGRARYTLTGERGASYSTMRRVNQPELMFLVHKDARKFGIPSGFDSVLLTDSDGGLRVVR
jgi:hypothetical protein